MKKNCELCGSGARMYCESDQASLCWDCDSKVHGANFLVAKHSRSLLCHVCHSPTPWNASGPKLTPTLSVCEACVHFHRRRRSDLDHHHHHHDEEDEEEEESYGVNDDDEEEEEEEEENGENQVVPWSFSSSPPPSLDGASSSSEDREVRSAFDSKRSREVNVDLDSDAETTSCCSFRSTKRARLTSSSCSLSSSSSAFKSKAIVKSLERLQKDAITGDENPSATILGICKLAADDHNR